MRFQVPQFIDMEDKIFGPLSFKEFSYIAGGCGLSYILYRFIPSFLLALVFIVPILAFAAALAFYRPNNKPFIEMVQAALVFAMGKKLYIWKKEDKPIQMKEYDLSEKKSPPRIPTITESKLGSINWNLDTQSKGSGNKNVDNDLNIRI